METRGAHESIWQWSPRAAAHPLARGWQREWGMMRRRVQFISSDLSLSLSLRWVGTEGRWELVLVGAASYLQEAGAAGLGVEGLGPHAPQVPLKDTDRITTGSYQERVKWLIHIHILISFSLDGQWVFYKNKKVRMINSSIKTNYKWLKIIIIVVCNIKLNCW